LDRQQLEIQLGKSYDRVLRGLIAVAGSREQGEDAFHDALEAALLPSALNRIERSDAWLYAVGLRALRRARWKRRLDSPLEFLRRSVPAPSAERIEALALLDELAPRQREILVARFYLDLSYKEIAHGFGISVGTATATVSQALVRLRASRNGDLIWARLKT
jgi:RNA polymerase sigma factor (sigma-70 family)